MLNQSWNWDESSRNVLRRTVPRIEKPPKNRSSFL